MVDGTSGISASIGKPPPIRPQLVQQQQKEFDNILKGFMKDQVQPGKPTVSFAYRDGMDTNGNREIASA